MRKRRENAAKDVAARSGNLWRNRNPRSASSSRLHQKYRYPRQIGGETAGLIIAALEKYPLSQDRLAVDSDGACMRRRGFAPQGLRVARVHVPGMTYISSPRMRVLGEIAASVCHPHGTSAHSVGPVERRERPLSAGTRRLAFASRAQRVHATRGRQKESAVGCAQMTLPNAFFQGSVGKRFAVVLRECITNENARPSSSFIDWEPTLFTSQSTRRPCRSARRSCLRVPLGQTQSRDRPRTC